MALIVSHALPKGLQTFDQIDGVWVTEPRCAVAVAIALRESLIALAAARVLRRFIVFLRVALERPTACHRQKR
jgi:hypothetical protein